MFSRVVHSARALLSRSPSKSSETSTAVSNDEAAAMVATRSGADTNSPLTNSATRSARKRFQDDTPNGTPTRNNKKRKSSADEEELETPKIPLLAREEPQSTPNTQTTKTSEPSSETPMKERVRPRKNDNSLLEQVVTPNPAEKKGKASAETPREKETSEQQHGSQDDASIYGSPAEDDNESIYATPATTLRPNLRGSARPTPASVTPKPRGRAARNTPSKPSRLISSQTIDEGEEEKTPKPEPPKEANKPKIIRFGSEDPPEIPEPAPEPPKRTEIPSSSADEDSDDEAPEAVTASSAREQARAAEEDAAKAVKVQEAAAKRKRQEREARLREQAAASKRRKQRKEAESALDPEDVSPPADVASSTTITASNPATLSKQSKPAYNLQNIPALLPDELLAAAPAVRPPSPEPAERGTGMGRKEDERKKLNKHLKFLDEKPAKDIKKGPVRLHVLEKGNKKLPPKANNQSKNMRDQWLAGRRAQPAKGRKGLSGPERKKTGGGFLRN